MSSNATAVCGIPVEAWSTKWANEILPFAGWRLAALREATLTPKP